MILHLGVLDEPYTQENPETTGEVAQELEDRYGIMAFFVDDKMKAIVTNLEESFAESLESIILGAPDLDVFANGCQKIEKDFRNFLDNKEMDGKVDGVPTQASIEGVSHRFKYKTRKRASKVAVRNKPKRPSFIDTGLYQQSFKVWVDQ